MKRTQLTDEDRAQMKTDALALKRFGSWDDVKAKVDEANPGTTTTKEAIRQASEGTGGSGVARVLRRAAAVLLEGATRAQVEPAVEGYPNRAAFLRLYGDKLPEPVREHIATYGGFDGDVSIKEWATRALEYERDRDAFEKSLRGIGDAGGFGDPGPVKPQRRKPSTPGGRRA